MEIEIRKAKKYVLFYYKTDTGIGCCGSHRPNSAMTKDLIKEEMMCRVYSFRPNPLSLTYLYGYKHVVSGFMKGSSPEKK